MPYLTWNDELSVGIPEMDEQHKKWIVIMNELHDAMKEGKTSAIMAGILKKMTDYITFHFSSEEAMMKSVNYYDLFNHKKIHDQYALKTKELVDKFNCEKTLLSIEVMNSLKDWLTDHIMVNDKKYGQFLKNK